MEFEEGLSNEAKFARSMDRLEPLLQNTLNNGGPRKEYGLKFLRFTTKRKQLKKVLLNCGIMPKNYLKAM